MAKKPTIKCAYGCGLKIKVQSLHNKYCKAIQNAPQPEPHPEIQDEMPKIDTSKELKDAAEELKISPDDMGSIQEPLTINISGQTPSMAIPTAVQQVAQPEQKRYKRPGDFEFDPRVVGKVWAGIFAAVATWTNCPEIKLTEDETELMGDTWAPVCNQYLPEWMKRHGPLIGALIVTGSIAAAKYANYEEKQKRNTMVRTYDKTKTQS